MHTILGIICRGPTVLTDHILREIIINEIGFVDVVFVCLFVCLC